MKRGSNPMIVRARASSKVDPWAMRWPIGSSPESTRGQQLIDDRQALGTVEVARIERPDTAD
jgi:hypothetical protein